jgi:hypothetical protein
MYVGTPRHGQAVQVTRFVLDRAVLLLGISSPPS